MMNKESGVFKAWEATVRKTQAAKKRANSLFGSISVANVEEEEDDDEEAEENDNNSNSNNSNSNNNNSNNKGSGSGSGSGSGGGGGFGGEIINYYQAEKVLPNGDYYTGEWSENFPHGRGKYLWTDGCMYVGEWVRGKSMGRGRFSWPSGATYEGEFKTGYMDGSGAYTGPSGDSYRGQWVMNLKHGNGTKHFPNGDIYQGEWRRGLQEGQGKYQWKNGNHYIGEWKNGEICGKGTFFWTNGNRYDGFWEGGFPKGNGTFKWGDGGFYVGNWSRDPTEHNGTFYPSASSPDAHLDWDPQDVYNVYLSDSFVSPNEKVSILPSHKKLAVWRSTKAVSDTAKPRRTSVDGRVSVGIERPFDRMRMWDGNTGNGGGGEDFVGDHRPSSVGTDREFDEDLLGLCVEDVNSRGSYQQQQIRVSRKAKRQGETICKGHKNYELMLNLQLGIR